MEVSERPTTVEDASTRKQRSYAVAVQYGGGEHDGVALTHKYIILDAYDARDAVFQVELQCKDLFPPRRVISVGPYPF